MLKEFIQKQKVKAVAVAGTTYALVAGVSTKAFAVGTANADVVTGLSGVKDDIVATLGAIAPVAIGIMAVFLAWKYGRKIFHQVGK